MAAVLGSIAWVAEPPNDDPAIGTVGNPIFLSDAPNFLTTRDAGRMPEAVTLPEANWIVPDDRD
jgi:hypothetical protein